LEANATDNKKAPIDITRLMQIIGNDGHAGGEKPFIQVNWKESHMMRSMISVWIICGTDMKRRSNWSKSSSIRLKKTVVLRNIDRNWVAAH
jgi:hypothetical protein